MSAIVALTEPTWAGRGGGGAGGGGHFGGGGFAGGHSGGAHFGGSGGPRFGGGGFRAAPSGFGGTHFAGRSLGGPTGAFRYYSGGSGASAARTYQFSGRGNQLMKSNADRNATVARQQNRWSSPTSQKISTSDQQT